MLNPEPNILEIILELTIKRGIIKQLYLMEGLFMINKDKILNDITILFSGYNIKWLAVLAIESFLYFNPDLRKNVVYFDDESDDGTKKELKSRGIRVITWLPQIKKSLIIGIRRE